MYKRGFPWWLAESGPVYIDTDSAPRIVFYGEDFLLEDFPVGTRVIYP